MIDLKRMRERESREAACVCTRVACGAVGFSLDEETKQLERLCLGGRGAERRAAQTLSPDSEMRKLYKKRVFVFLIKRNT